MDATGFFFYFGIRSLFLMACMTVLGWVSRKTKWKSAQQRITWIGAWAVIGFLFAASLAITAWIMNTDFIYYNASLVWPFCRPDFSPIDKNRPKIAAGRGVRPY
jgi:hypothetical protein